MDISKEKGLTFSDMKYCQVINSDVKYDFRLQIYAWENTIPPHKNQNKSKGNFP
jgi:hypothetical protein